MSWGCEFQDSIASALLSQTMERSSERIGYLIAVLGTALVLVVRMALEPALAEQARLLPFVLSVMAAARWGGLRPGLFATILGALVGVFFIVPPPLSLRIETVSDGVNAVTFIFIGATVSYLCDQLLKTRRRETEKQFRELADAMPQLVWMARPDGARFWHNRRWTEFTGASPEQLAGTGWQSYCDPTALPRVLLTYQAAFARGEPWEETYPLRRSDGEMRWFLARAVPIRNLAGDIVCWFGTSTDIEKRIEVEQAFKDADSRKDQFLAVLAHELRNPLAPISNALQLWPHVMGDKAELEHVRAVIDRQVQQLVRLIDDLMDLSRISRGKISLKEEQIEINAVIARAIETVEPSIDNCNHRLTLEMPPHPVVIFGDAARLTQVFSNILNNAAKYTVRNGEISVHVDELPNQVAVTIRDNGPGIPPQMLTEIFEPFRQVDMTLSHSHGGLGVGLWLAKQLVELHGGTIEARSPGPGKGSEFEVVLPTVTTVIQAAPSLAQPEAAPKLDRHRILVVDDFRESAETLAMVLRSKGQDATAIYNGEAAIQWVLEHHPDAVFLDIAMPGLDGYEVARRLRSQPELRGMVLVALTGYGQHEDRRRSREAGFDFHLTKPTNFKKLEDLLLTLPVSHPLSEASAV